MSSQTVKPKLSAHQLIQKMKNEKGITFKYTSEEEAAEYLTNINNYLRTAAYRKNYQKHAKGPNAGKYINLDFSYLKELSTIDMHFRFIISKMCLDIEHALKVKIVQDIEKDPSTDGYDIVRNFLDNNSFIVRKLEATSSSPFTSELIHKYFAISREYNNRLQRAEHHIYDYSNCPIWVLVELLTFGDFIRLYNFYYSKHNSPPLSASIINLVKNLRNAAAHNTCILANLSSGTSQTPAEISCAVAQIPDIKGSQRKKKLSCRPMLEFICLLYTYKSVVSEKVRYHRIKELSHLFYIRMPEKKYFFKDNELIKSNYEFACKIIHSFFDL